MFEQMQELPATAAACVDELERLERSKSAIAAQQARLTVRLAELSPTASERGVAAQVALARHESPHRGRRFLTMARALVEDLPLTMAALAAGDLSEHRAELVAREGADLLPEDLAVYDTVLHRGPARPDPGLIPDGPDSRAGVSLLAGLGDLDVTDAARRVALRLDQETALRRRERAATRRRLTARRLPDGMMSLTAVISDVHATAVMGTLHRHAETLHARAARRAARAARDTAPPVDLDAGDPEPVRTVAQIAADLFVNRLLQPTPASVATASDSVGAGGVAVGDGVVVAPSVHVELVVSAETLLAGSTEPAELVGHGPIPAEVARQLVDASPEEATSVRRLFAAPGRLVAMESTTRAYDGLLRRFLLLRDRRCRTPWCNARITQIDHVRRVRDGGPTTAINGEGLCTPCNLTKEDPGWTYRVQPGPSTPLPPDQPSQPGQLDDSAHPGGPHHVSFTTPTGHRHHSRAPDPVGHPSAAPAPRPAAPIPRAPAAATPAAPFVLSSFLPREYTRAELDAMTPTQVAALFREVAPGVHRRVA